MRSLAELLRPGGLLHLFLYADGGRWEIHRTQRCLTRLGVGCGEEGLRLGRQFFEDLPEQNRLRRNHEQRWAIDTHADANFADMYLHPQETSYNLERLMTFVAGADLQFAGFSNPHLWDPSRLLQGELLERARALPERERWSLVEDLDPEISHFEFFLSKGPVQRCHWQDDAVLVGHLPFMGKLASFLVTGEPGKSVAAFRPGSMICLERGADDTWSILWMLRPELLA